MSNYKDLHPGDEVQLARHLRKIDMNVRRYLARWFKNQVEKDPEWLPLASGLQQVTPEQRRAQERAVFVGGSLAQKLVKEYKDTGMIDRNLSTFKKFCADMRFARQNLRREEIKFMRGGITGVGEEEWNPKNRDEPGLRVIPAFQRNDEDGEYSLLDDAFENSMEILWGSVIPSLEPLADPEWMKILATVLLPRIIEVLGQRNGHGSLSAEQVESLWLVLAEVKVGVVIPQHVQDFLASFDPKAETWRQQLAARRAAAGLPGATPSAISNDINRARRLLTTCLYLFVTLAPYSSVVTQVDDMDTLLDFIFTSNSVLPTNQRKVLRFAGECLSASGPQYQVSLDEVHALTRKVRGLNNLTEEGLLDFLHDAEEPYAIQVPGQDRIRPRYSCVKQCPTHL